MWCVEFAGRQPEGGVAGLAQAVAGALGLRDDAPAGLPGPGGADEAEQLAAALRDRGALLVFDNCEQVVEEAAELTDRLLRAAPGLRVLATSQEPLALAGEAVFAVEPLLPADAMSLFAERAAAAAPGFSLDGHEDAVAEICRRLDGIPLALELAATRVRSLGVAELAARLDDRFRLLDASRRGVPARQRTLRAMIDWSWELLSAPERTVLRRLAVHREGCTLEAAEVVCAGDGVAREEVSSLVGRLVDRSLVTMVTGPSGTRYRLLESVAAYAVDRLRDAAELDAVRGRHLRHYLDLAERAEPRLRDAGQRLWLERLDAEAGNLRAALDAAARGTGSEDGAAVRLAVALAWWWLLRGRLTEGRRALSAVLGTARDHGDLRLLRDAFALLTGERATPEPAPGHAPGHARPLWLHAYGLFSAGQVTAAEKTNARALALAEAVEQSAGATAEATVEARWVVAAALGLRGMLTLGSGAPTAGGPAHRDGAGPRLGHIRPPLRPRPPGPPHPAVGPRPRPAHPRPV
ncbi:ATP-binding protein, partial [Streptomyces flavofungini]|uniref:ATP-binding protein n=1 Tax=Streptomyces flavofungini TaxID=68200 RepID=UPI003F8070BA